MQKKLLFSLLMFVCSSSYCASNSKDGDAKSRASNGQKEVETLPFKTCQTVEDYRALLARKDLPAFIDSTSALSALRFELPKSLSFNEFLSAVIAPNGISGSLEEAAREHVKNQPNIQWLAFIHRSERRSFIMPLQPLRTRVHPDGVGRSVNTTITRPSESNEKEAALKLIKTHSSYTDEVLYGKLLALSQQLVIPIRPTVSVPAATPAVSAAAAAAATSTLSTASHSSSSYSSSARSSGAASSSSAAAPEKKTTWKKKKK